MRDLDDRHAHNLKRLLNVAEYRKTELHEVSDAELLRVRGKCSNPKDDSLRARGLPETSCQVDLGTGEITCHHRARAPRQKDCRQPWCFHAREMRARIVTRLRRVRAQRTREERS